MPVSCWQYRMGCKHTELVLKRELMELAMRPVRGSSFFGGFYERRSDSELRASWGKAEQAGVNYGLQVMSERTGQWDFGGREGFVFSHFLNMGDSYRTAVRENGYFNTVYKANPRDPSWIAQGGAGFIERESSAIYSERYLGYPMFRYGF